MDSFGPLYPDLLPRIARIQADAQRVTGYQTRLTDGGRSYSSQAARYAIGRTVVGEGVDKSHPLGLIVTNASPGLSWHQYGLAADCCFVGKDPYLEQLAESDPKAAAYSWTQFGVLVKAYGFRWGGEFHLLVDRPHIELTYGLTIHEAIELYRNGGIKGVWTQIDKIRGVDTTSLWPDLSQAC